MIAKPVVVTYDYVMDEATKIAVCNGEYVKFTETVAEDGAVSESYAPILVADAMNEYVAAQIRVPDEFTAVREAVQTKINALQAVL